MVRTKRTLKQTTATQDIRGLIRKVEILQQRAQQLSAEQECLSVQQHILARICDLLHCLRTGNVHQGWVDCCLDGWTDPWLLQEVPLLRDLGVPHNSSLAAHLSQLQLTIQKEQHKHSNQVQLLQLQQPQHQPRHASTGDAQDDVVCLVEAADSELMPLAPAAAEEAAVPASNTVAAVKQRGSLLPTGNSKSSPTAQAEAAMAAARTGSQGVSAAPPAAATAAGGAGTAAPPWAPPPQPAQAPTAPPMYLADAGDYLGVLMYVFSQPRYPGAADMTLQQFGEYYTTYVRDLALHLSLAEQQVPQFKWTSVTAAPPDSQQQPAPLLGPREGQAAVQGCPASSSQDNLQQQQQPLQDQQQHPQDQQQDQQQGVGADHPLHAVRALFLNQARLIVSLTMLHQGDLLHRIRACNLNTLQVADGGDQTWQRTCWLVEQLQLRSDQQTAMISGNSLFKQLIGQVLAARQELLQQQQQQAALRLPSGRAVDLDEQDQLAKRLQVLMKKELFLVTCASAFVIGVLDLVQLAKSVVLMWPFLPQMMMLGPVVEKKVQKERQQEQEQGQQEQGMQ